MPALLEANGLSKRFTVRDGMRRAQVSAVDNVSFDVRAGSTMGVVGESGCGKSTLARLIVGLHAADEGQVRFDGVPLSAKLGRRPRQVVEQMQMVFQDPYSALNPRASIGESIGFPLQAQGVARTEVRMRVAKVLEDVGLSRNHVNHYPHQLSGGQRQRVNIARALILRPKLIVLDEAVSALDKSIQAQILNLLEDLQEEYELTYIFISHDLNVVQYMSDHVTVMYLGQVVESCDAKTLYQNPQHPYTKMLLESVPTLDLDARGTEPDSAEVTGELPSPLDPPSGCRFRTRCPFAMDVCADKTPNPMVTQPGHLVACHLYTGEFPAKQGED
jgi:peptide/nickel transport system ATP-binding protein